MSEVSRDEIADWIVEALSALGGSAHYVSVAKEIWKRHKAELPESSTSFFTWQYDMRWAGQKLRRAGVIENSHGSDVAKGVWKLTGKAV
ncbi:MAG: hypothetical protein RLO80_14150 [Hyphomonas sp.]